MSQLELPVELEADFEELSPIGTGLIVYSRDWTIQTIVTQITKGNIDLNPKFQRRNAWKDDKRMRLVESLLLSYPVPEIVLAEDKLKKGKFIVIDGKQRLQTLAGLYTPNVYKVWDKEKLKKSLLIPSISNISFEDFFTKPCFEDLTNQLENADIRCTIISNYKNDDVLYDIFYRLNTGSSPLSSQELRQALNKGKFSEFLISYTDEPKELHKVLDIESADDRLVDADLLLRCLAFYRQSELYAGNQKAFLDGFVTEANAQWDIISNEIEAQANLIMDSIKFISNIIDYKSIGRKTNNGNFDWRFNKVLFEVQVLFATNMNLSCISPAKAEAYRQGLSQLVEHNPEFKSSIESTTKSMDNYRKRFSLYEHMFREVFGSEVIFTSKIR